MTTLGAVRRKLDEPMTMGYASAGVVVACGAGVRGFKPGGDPAFPKERIEVIGGGRVAVIDDFRRVTLVAGGKTTTRKGSRWTTSSATSCARRCGSSTARLTRCPSRMTSGT